MVKYIRFCLEEYWETCHPELDADDDDDPTMRVNAVLGLGFLGADAAPATRALASQLIDPALVESTLAARRAGELQLVQLHPLLSGPSGRRVTSAPTRPCP